MIPVTHLEVVTDQMIEGPKERKIDTAQRAAEWAAPLFPKNNRERFYVCMMNNACEPLAVELVGIGGKTSCVVDVSCVYQQAVLSGASMIICFHNHTSGHPEPSEEDIRVTQKLKAAGKILDIKLADHIIVGNKNYFSFREQGLL